MDWYSAFWLDSTHGWCATHRLPLESAIFYCENYTRYQDTPVAIVPHSEDPAPYLAIAEKAAAGYAIELFPKVAFLA